MPEEPVRHRDVNVKAKSLENFPFHHKEFLSLVGIITNVQEVINPRGTVLLNKK